MGIAAALNDCDKNANYPQAEGHRFRWDGLELGLLYNAQSLALIVLSVLLVQLV